MDDPAGLRILSFEGPDPPLVFLGEHGFRASVWRPISDGFAAEHARLEVDLNGPVAGPTRPRPAEERRAATSPAALTRLLHEALVARRQLSPFVLLGVGFGAVVAEEYAQRESESLLGVVLVNLPHVPAHQWRARLREEPVERLLAHPHPDLVRLLEAARVADDQASRDVEDVLRVEVHTAFDEHRLPLPTLIVAGDVAPLTSLARVCELRRDRAQVSIAVCNGAGHFPMLEAPVAFDAALRRFLAHLHRDTHAALGAWSYRPDCVWPAGSETEPERFVGDVETALKDLQRYW